jgi:type III restriction enzyme
MKRFPYSSSIDGEGKLYFIVKTKSKLCTDAFRPTEKAKIVCGNNTSKPWAYSMDNDTEFAMTNAFEDFTGRSHSKGD